MLIGSRGAAIPAVVGDIHQKIGAAQGKLARDLWKDILKTNQNRKFSFFPGERKKRVSATSTDIADRNYPLREFKEPAAQGNIFP